MKLTANSSLLITMPIIGIAYGAVFHYVLMPMFGNSIIHCVTLGTTFGFINYFIAMGIYKKYNLLKKSNKKLQSDLKVDKLTGAFNRGAFDNDMDKLQDKGVYSMIFIDIDNFKKFNDQYGHKTGDEVLIKVAKAIQSSIRSSDKAYRYGGEEFVVVLHNCDKDNALDIAEKIRKSISNIENQPYPSITASLGVSTFPEDGSTVQTIVETCDSALLKAKSLGKNRTFVCVTQKHEKRLIM